MHAIVAYRSLLARLWGGRLVQLRTLLPGSRRVKSRASVGAGRQFASTVLCGLAGVVEQDVNKTLNPRERGADINQRLVCLFITHASRKLAKFTIEGTISALDDW